MAQYIIPAVFAFLGGLFLWLIKRERLALEYDIEESDLFPRDGGVGKYFVCKLINSGNRAIENISLNIEITEGKIDSIEYSNSQLLTEEKQTDSLLQASIPLLNPKEHVGAIITIKNAQEHSYLKIEARSVGITGRKRSTESIPQYLNAFLIAVAIGVIVSFVLSAWNSVNQSKIVSSIENIGGVSELSKRLETSKKRLEQIEEENKRRREELKRDFDELERKRKLGEPRREQIIFSLLNRSGLSYVIPGLITISGEGLPYWKTGLHLMHSYLLDKENASKYVQALSELADEKSIAPSSKGFLLYLAGKIERAEGNVEASIRYFEACKKDTPLMYDYMMSQDPAYDLKKIEA